MNRGLHRLVFCRRVGGFVAVAETARRRVRQGAGALTLGALLLPLAELGAQTRPPVVFAGQVAAPANPLPQPYGTLRTPGGGFVNDPALRSFVANPAHRDQVRWSVAPDGRSATLNQGNVDRVILNWDRFDIGAGHRVHFEQNPDPTRYVSALNRIWSADPSVIMGRLTATREVILVNANGVYFGRGAQVDTGKFVASALNIADSVFERGLRNVVDGSAVFTAAGGELGPTNPDAAVSVEPGAVIRSAAGGDVLLIAPRVVNAGRIDTPQGQSVLAAGQRVYLMSSSDPAQRGLIVAVDPFALSGSTAADPTLGVAENRADGSAQQAADGVAAHVNEIRADSGRVNLVGLTVRQAGVINVTTAVKGANGVVMLQAMSATERLGGGTAPNTATSRRGLVVEDGASARASAGGGTVDIAAGSVTQVLPSQSGATQLQAEVFNPSLIYAEGERIAVGEGAQVQAPAGRIELLAAASRSRTPLFDRSETNPPSVVDGSRIVIAPGARISAAGLQAVPVDGARNQGAQRLFRIELADSPVQRDGPLYREQLFFDARGAGRIAVANVSGAASAVALTAPEQSTRGGSLRIESEGAVLIAPGAELDVSGGSVRVSAATLQESQVVRDGAIVRFSQAQAGTRYDALLDQTRTTQQPAYDEGRDGGTLQLGGRRLVVDGQLQGAVIEGERQAAGLDAAARPATLVIGRAPGLPGGVASPYLGRLELREQALPPSAALWADPWAVPLAALPAATSLSLQAVEAGGFGRLQLRAADLVQPVFGTLDLGLRGELDILAKTVSLDGEFLAAGGLISIRTDEASSASADSGLGDVHLSARSRLDVAGLWTNNNAQGGATTLAPLQLAGGTLRLAAAHDLQLAPGAVLDVSGGARLSNTGALTWGSAGSLSLASGRSDQFETRLGIEGALLRGFDAGRGGELSIASPELWIGAARGSGFGLELTPGFFSAGGFGRVSIDAQGEVRVGAGTLLEPVLSSWLAAPGRRQVPSGRMSEAVATIAPVDEQLADRQPVNLTLRAGRTPNPGLGIAASDLVVERGATLRLEAGGALSLAATGSLLVGVQGGAPGQATRLEAPGGTIRLTLQGERGRSSAAEGVNDAVGFDARQVLWFGAGAVQSVAGVAELRPDASPPVASTFGGAVGSGQRLTGQVLGGGLIEWQAQRGYVVAEAGSSTVLDGAAAQVHLSGASAPVLVARPAGRWAVSSPEGVVLDGRVSARAPTDASGRALADGGALDISIGAGGVGRFTAGPAFPGGERVAVIGEHGDVAGTRGAVPGGELVSALGNGVAYVPEALLADAGFDQWRIAAGDRVRFDQSIQLSAPIAITLDTPVISATPGAAVTLQAHTLALGDRTGSRRSAVADPRARPDADPAGATRLHAKAQTLDVAGRLWLQGFSAAHLDAGLAAGGELRFSAANPQNPSDPTQLEGLLGFDGTLRLDASRTFATTASLFTVQGADGSRLQLGTGRAGAATTAPLSVFGELVLQADSIDQQGVLWQPFGAITLAARERLTLGDGSLTSVSGAGLTRLYGSTANLSIWQLPSQGRGGNDRPETLPLAKAVTLQAPVIEAAARAKVDVAGGGDVLAPEFFAGVGGSTDLFDTAGLFAVLPDFGTTATSALAGGPSGISRELVVTMDGSGLARGAYALLPARYALMGGSLPQGAYLVRRAADQGRSLLGAPLVQDDGAVIVTGSVRDAGSVHLGPPGERWVVESQNVFSQRSEVRLTSVSSLLAGYAAAVDLASPLRPVDGGALRVQVTGDSGSGWRGDIAAGASGGRAGTLDVAATRLALVDALSKAPEGFFGIESGTLAASGAGSVLIGGRRTAAGFDAAGVARESVDASGTQALRVDLGSTPLALEELVLASSGSLEVAAGSRLAAQAEGTLGPRQLALSGPGALAFVSANPLTATREGAAPGAGRLSLAAGVSLAGASVGLDATAALALDARVAFDAGRLALSAPTLALGGSAGGDTSITAISGPLLRAVQGSEALALRGYQGLQFIGAQDWTVPAAGSPGLVLGSLLLDSPRISVRASSEGTSGLARLAARDIELRNSGAAAAAGPLAAEAGSSLQLLAAPPLRGGFTGGIGIGPGTLAVAAADVQLRSLGDIVLSGAGGLATAGNLTLSAARLTATSAAEHRLSADNGSLRVALESGSRTLGETVGLGADVTLRGQTLVQDGHIALPSGALTLQAAGTTADAVALRLGAGSTTSVGGQALDNGRGFIADSLAGTLALQAGLGAIELQGRLDARSARRADGTAGEGDGGRIRISAGGEGGALQIGEAARLDAAGGHREGDRGGQLTVDVRRLPATAPLLAAVASGGIDGRVALRVREGDVLVAQDLRAERIDLAADGGSLRIDAATLDARAPDGGLVRLAARDELALGAGSRVDVRASRAGARGGELLASSSNGTVRVLDGAAVDAGDGRITLRAPRTGDARGLDVAPLDAGALQAAEVVLEAVRVYDGISSIRAGNSSGSTLGLGTLASDNAAYAAAAPAALGALGITGPDAARYSLRAGVEVRSPGALTLASEWNLAGQRPGGQAGALTLRAAGTLTIAQSLSDGFVTPAANAALATDGQAWALRLVGGADLGAADPMATSAAAAADLSLAANVRVRTGAASLEMAAARDVLFGGSGSTAATAYVAGAPLPESAEVLDSFFARQAAKPQLTGGGLRLEVQAGRDIVAPEASQLFNNWLWRSGLIQPTGAEAGLYAGASQLAWWSQFSAFAQTLGGFGGAGLQVEAGRDIVNLQAMVPSVGWADSRDPAAATLQVRGGGDLQVQAGRDLLGGQFLVAAGDGRLVAGRHIAGASANRGLVDVQLAQMNDAGFKLQSRLDLSVAGSLNPTATPTISTRNNLSRFFYTWGDAAALELRAAAGQLVLGAPTADTVYGLSSLQGALRVQPATLMAYATGGAMQLLRTESALLFPNAGADLRLWAAEDLRLGTTSNAVLAMADSDPGLWPSFRRPESLGPVLTSADSLLASSLADALPRSALHQGAASPVQLHAGASLLSQGLSSWLLPKAAQLSADLDILNLRLLGQNLTPGDRTELVAGRNLLAGLQGYVELGGPGVLDVRAGRDVNLGSSSGLVSIGNRKSPALPTEGASIRLAAATDGVLDLAVLDRWRQRDPEVQAQVTRYVRETLRAPELDGNAAWRAFEGLSEPAQAALGRQVLADAFRRQYLDGPAATTASVSAALRAGFDERKRELLAAGDAALQARGELVLPGRERLSGAELAAYLDGIRALRFESLELDSTVAARVADLNAVRDGWLAAVAAGRDSAADFERYREQVLERETVAAASAASNFGRLSLPMRLALFDQGFAAAELAGAGSFVAQPVWPGAPLLRHAGALEMTQSAVITERGGNISLINPGGGINVGLKDAAGSGPKGVIALGGGNVFGYAQGDFQVNVQRVFIVGQGNMAIWSSAGDIDSGRGANTAVAAPPLAPRRSADGVVFEIPATTTGSGLGIVPDALGRVDGSIGLYPAFGEILALDAFIRAPRIELGATVRGADNLGGGSVSGATATVAAPATAVSSPPPSSQEDRSNAAAPAASSEGARERQSLLTVELLGIGPGEPCEGLAGAPLDECRRRLATEPPRPRP
jgi:filamentous hemagglutinin